jgi:predicted PurR-regulated permease PerM
MNTDLPVQTPPDPLESKVERSRQAWKRLGMTLGSITPQALGRALLLLSALAGVGWLAVASWPALLPFIVGGVLAYIIAPLVDALDWLLPRFLAALVGVLLVLFGIGALLWVIVPPLVTQATILVQQIPPDMTLKDLSGQLIVRLESLPPSLRIPIANAILNAADRLAESIRSLAPTMLSTTTIVRLLNAVGFILGLVVLPTWLLTVLKDKPRGRRALNNVLPGGIRADFWAVLRIIDRSFGTFLRGQVLVGLMVGLVTYVGLKFLVRLGIPDSPYLVLFAVLAGLFQLIPEVGPLVNTVLVVLLAYRSSGSILALYVLALYVGIQYLFGGMLKGRIEQRIIDVNPALLMLFIVALGQLGWLWLFLAAPVAGMVRDLFRYLYGRLSDPPQPAGVLPGDALPGTTPQLQSRRRVPGIYQRMQNSPRKQ